MLLKNPQMLWGLILLVIPILVHLLRLRKYRRTSFTNVRILQRLLTEANKSSELKRWLLLLARLGLISALVIAFCQPYSANPRAGDPREIVVYVDNSFSMQAPVGTNSALVESVQGLLRLLPEDAEIGLVTHTDQYRIQPLNDLRERLLTLDFTHQGISAPSLSFRAASVFNEDAGAIREFWMFSDFEDLSLSELDTSLLGSLHAVRYPGEPYQNIALDTAILRSQNSDLMELEVRVRLQGLDEGEPLSLYNGDTLIAKSAPELLEKGIGQAIFSLPATDSLRGSIRILDKGLAYDNTLYFTIQRPPKIKVYGIGDGSWDYLNRIYTPDEFRFTQSPLAELDYSRLDEQHLILLNELDRIPPALSRELVAFMKEGGSVIVIPAQNADLNSYNRFITESGGPNLGEKVDSENRITEIRTGHPLFRDVFEREVQDFEYPKTDGYWRIGPSGISALAYQNGDPFLSSRGNLYVFAAALNEANSSFSQSPLVVPTFYNMGRQSLPFPELYYTIGQAATVDIETTLQEDNIIRLEGDSYSFVPRQQGYARKTRLSFIEEPPFDGHYQVLLNERNQGMLGFNYPRNEGRNAMETSTFPPEIKEYDSMEALVERYQNDIRVRALWKWFVILALLFAVAELILQKTIR